MSREFSGKLDQRVVLQQPVDAADGGGGQNRIWQDIAELWAHVMPVVFDERRYAGHVATRERYHIWVRRDGDIALDARLIWRGQALSILAVADDPAAADRLRITAEQERES